MAELDFDDIADELYSLPLDEFTPTRTEYEKRAKAAGDRDLAERIKRLAKPNVAAWLTNQLVREHRDELTPLLEIGAGLREATRKLAGDQLRELSKQQQKLTFALVQHVRELGRANNQNVTEDTKRAIEQTLHAALADERAAELLLEGRLTAPLQRTGFDDVGPVGKVLPFKPRKPAEKKADASAAAATQIAEADRLLADATAARDQATAEVDDATAAVDAAQSELDELSERLADAKQRLAEAQRGSREATAALRIAERAVTRAVKRRGDLS